MMIKQGAERPSCPCARVDPKEVRKFGIDLTEHKHSDVALWEEEVYPLRVVTDIDDSRDMAELR
jgi:hypothetical protein